MLYTCSNNQLYIEVDSLGAGLMSLRDLHGTEYLWQGDPKYWKGRSPILFPIVGALRGGKAVIDGREYGMPRHGLARIHPFQKIESGADSLTFRLDADEETRTHYPFDFSLEVCFALSGRTLTERFTVRNRDQKPMPFCLGCHPGFNIPLEEGESLSDYTLRFEKTENCDSPLIDPTTDLILEKTRRPVLTDSNTLPLSHELFYKDALVLENLQSRSVTLSSAVSCRGVRMDFDGFDYFGIWQAKDAPFLCLEPWTGTATTDQEGDDFAGKRGMHLLAPGTEQEYILKITLL
ncbi:MAG: aldose 1-epimerase family protein [Candidatus Howiella sp.]|jgi:galactose mutarotase-like enzyme